MLNKQELGLIALVRSAMQGRSFALPEGFSLPALFPVIRKHQIAPIILRALDYYDFPEAVVCRQKLLQSTAQSLLVSENQSLEAQQIYEAFEKAQVDYAPLKGSLIKQLYPQENLRSMADVDILVRVSQLDRFDPIMQALGYERETESDHEYNWRKGYVHIELHKSLVPSYDTDYYAYYGDGWKLFRRSEGCRFEMSVEDQFVYLFTHYAKHFRDGGIGVKHLTDLWVLREAKPEMDEKYIMSELKKLRLDEFYRNVRKTFDFWFADGELTENVERITHEIISGGAYGKAESNRMAEAIRNAPNNSKGSKFRWTMRKIFLPYKNMCMKYPFLRYVPFLLPIMWVVRWITALVCKPKTLKQDVKNARSMSQESVDAYRVYLASLGLQFEAKE